MAFTKGEKDRPALNEPYLPTTAINSGVAVLSFNLAGRFWRAGVVKRENWTVLMKIAGKDSR